MRPRQAILGARKFTGRRESPFGTAAVVLLALAVFAVAVDDGGLGAVAWDAGAVAMIALAVVVLRRPPRLRARSATWTCLAFAVVLLLWTAFSALWSGSLELTVLEFQRMLFYCVAAAATVWVGRLTGWRPLAYAAWAVCTALCVVALVQRLLFWSAPVHASIASTRLAGPVGYWNALGMIAALGAMIALGIAIERTHRPIGHAASASVPVLAVTLYLTFSRGAVAALVVGVLISAMAVRSTIRWILSAAAVGVFGLLAVAATVYQHALTRHPVSTSYPRARAAWIARASDEAHREVVIVVAVALLCVVLVRPLLDAIVRHADGGERWDVAVRGSLLAVPVVVMLAWFVALGSPGALGDSTKRLLDGSPPHQFANPNARFESVALNGRTLFWDVAWSDFKAHPLAGSGAGTYGAVWARDRDVPTPIVEAHSLYLETLAELGLIGLLLLVLVLGPPLVAGVRSRGDPLFSAVLGGYAAFLVHAGIDWDWAVPAVTLPALLCAGALLTHGTRPVFESLRHRRVRSVARTRLLAAAGICAVYLLVGQALVSGAQSALSDGRPAAARKMADHASTLLWWSAEPHLVSAAASLRLGDRGAARGELEEAVSADPRSWQAWAALAAVSSGAKRVQADEHLRRLNPLLSQQRPAYVVPQPPV